jgi:uncharacterized membrane protein
VDEAKGGATDLEELDSGWDSVDAGENSQDELDAGWDDLDLIEKRDMLSETEFRKLSLEERKARADRVAARKERLRAKAAAKAERRKARVSLAAAKQKRRASTPTRGRPSPIERLTAPGDVANSAKRDRSETPVSNTSLRGQPFHEIAGSRLARRQPSALIVTLLAVFLLGGLAFLLWTR